MGLPDYGKERGRLFYLSLPWFDERDVVPYKNARSQVFNGMVDLLFLQSQSGGANALYLAAKGGKGTLNHQQLDAGSFVIDANGERWGLDLGAENYFLPNFFDRKVGGGRWNYYRKTNKSHSTLVIGDDIQHPDGEGRIVKSKSEANQPFGIFDLTETYPGTSLVSRGFKLLSDDQALVRDEITFDGNPKKVRWGMMTDANVELMGDKVVLSKNGKKFFLQAFADEKPVFQFEAAKAYNTEAKDNAGNSLVFFEVNSDEQSEKIQFTVVMGNNMNGLNDTIVKSKLTAW